VEGTGRSAGIPVSLGGLVTAGDKDRCVDVVTDSLDSRDEAAIELMRIAFEVRAFAEEFVFPKVGRDHPFGVSLYNLNCAEHESQWIMEKQFENLKI
jgi:hypothetical protein